ncbi:MAG: ATP-dependent DNA ligase, partial [Proteobacteria bacterium]
MATKKRSRSRVALPKFAEPMKARLVERPPPGDWLYEVKLDGFRALALLGGSETKLVSRNDNDFATRFPEVVE